MDSSFDSDSFDLDDLPLVDLTVQTSPFPTRPRGVKELLPHMDTLKDFIGSNPFFKRLDTLNVLSIDTGEKNNWLVLVQVSIVDYNKGITTAKLLRHQKYPIRESTRREEIIKGIYLFAEQSGYFADAHVVLVEDTWAGVTAVMGNVWLCVALTYGCYGYLINPKSPKAYFGTGAQGSHYRNKLKSVAKYKVLEDTYKNTTRMLSPELLSVRFKDMDHFTDAILMLLFWIDENWYTPHYLDDPTRPFDATIPDPPLPTPKKGRKRKDEERLPEWEDLQDNVEDEDECNEQEEEYEQEVETLANLTQPTKRPCI